MKSSNILVLTLAFFSFCCSNKSKIISFKNKNITVGIYKEFLFEDKPMLYVANQKNPEINIYIGCSYTIEKSNFKMIESKDSDSIGIIYTDKNISTIVYLTSKNQGLIWPNDNSTLKDPDQIDVLKKIKYDNNIDAILGYVE